MSELPPHLADGPFLVPLSTSIWQPIKMCRLCYDYYDDFGLFNHNASITRSTIIRPVVAPADIRKTKYVEDVDEVSTKQGTPNSSVNDRKSATNLTINRSPTQGVQKLEDDAVKVKLTFDNDQIST